MSDEDKAPFPTRRVPVFVTDNGTPYAYSMISHKNIKIRAEVRPPLQLPGLIIFVHGVNSEGEWYNNAEAALCKGLNERLGLKGEFALIENTYEEGHLTPCDEKDSELNTYYGTDGNKMKWVSGSRHMKKDGEGRSPVIRFYWGYRSADHETDSYAIPLKNKRGDNYYDLSPEERKTKGP